MTNTNAKLTNRKALEIAMKAVTDEEVKEKLAKMIEALDKKASKKSETRNTARIEFADTIYALFKGEPNKVFSATDVARAFDFNYTVQKVTSGLTDLVADGKVTRIEDKKKKFYQLTK